MSIADVLLLDFDHEIANTRRVLERIPENDPQWKPHEKSMPIGRLSVHVARLPDFWTRMITTDEVNLATAKFPPLVFESTAHLLSDLDRSSAEARTHLEKSTDEQLNENWRLSWGDKVIAEAPRKVLYRGMFLNHLIHHRAQLGVYLRLLNIPVPGLYGPSADEPVS
ncbi:MAG TPA: DinB family protein [Bryobacteraceae bacterium]|jgi:uncharacterized damage-inducible protein DinB|nr:DinB family protein [Bryobacteraceae bacterium]